MVASGVRRSWETAPSSACRRRSTSSSSSERTACSCSWARSRASAAWLAKVRSRAQSEAEAGEPRRASMPTGRPDAVRATVRMASAAPGPVPRLTGTPDSGSRPWSSFRDRAAPYGGGDLEPVLPRDQQGHAGDGEHGADRADDGLQQVFDRPVVDQQLGQVEEALRLGRPLLRLGPGRLQAGDDPGRQQHDQHVHAERHPVRAGPHPEPVVGPDEAVVVDDEAGGHTDHAGPEPAQGDARHHRDHQHQGGGGDAQVRPQRAPWPRRGRSRGRSRRSIRRRLCAPAYCRTNPASRWNDRSDGDPLRGMSDITDRDGRRTGDGRKGGTRRRADCPGHRHQSGSPWSRSVWSGPRTGQSGDRDRGGLPTGAASGPIRRRPAIGRGAPTAMSGANRSCAMR